MVSEQDIRVAAERIRRGELVAFPTETVYGLGANAWDPLAVARVFELKGRPRFDPLIVHIAGGDALEDVARDVPDAARQLMRRFWPGPLSVVLPKKSNVPDIVTAGLPSVAVRCPAHDVALALIRAAGVPIAAPSANRFGAVSPTTAEHVREQFGDELPCVLDAGPCRVGVESTVVSFLGERPTLLRPGGVPLEEIEAVVGTVEVGTTEEVRPASPGQLPRHYSPATPLLLGDEVVPHGNRRLGLLTLQPPRDASPFAAVEVLSETGCLREAAANLFAALRRLDARGLDAIVARPVPEEGLGRAIMDRLRRAAAP